MITDGYDCATNQQGPVSGSCISTAFNLATLGGGGAVKTTSKQTAEKISKEIGEQVIKESAEQAVKEAAESGIKNITREAIEGCLTYNEDEPTKQSKLASLLVGSLKAEAKGCKIRVDYKATSKADAIKKAEELTGLDLTDPVPGQLPHPNHSCGAIGVCNGKKVEIRVDPDGHLKPDGSPLFPNDPASAKPHVNYEITDELGNKTYGHINY